MEQSCLRLRQANKAVDSVTLVFKGGRAGESHKCSFVCVHFPFLFPLRAYKMQCMFRQDSNDDNSKATIDSSTDWKEFVSCTSWTLPKVVEHSDQVRA